MGFGLGKLFKAGGATSANLHDDVRQELEAWRASPAPALEEPHFHTRYVILDIATSGPRAGEHELKGIAAVGMKAGAIVANDAFALDLSGDAAMVDRQLLAFLQYAAKAPLVTYHVSFVSSFLERVYKERLGVDFQPQWIDLTWLLPSLFKDKSETPLPLDEWLEICGLAGGGRRDPMANTLMIARLFQIMLARATTLEILSAGMLVDESKSASFLRRGH